MTPSPTILPPGSFDHFYRGGTQLAAFRGTEDFTHRPEEWLGSTVTRAGHDTNGLTVLGNTYLRDLIAVDPDGWLGLDHLDRYGVDTGVLVKLLDPGQRIPVHLHPTRRFARRHLDCPHGKTEAWVVLEGERGGGTVYLGTTRPVHRDEWAEMVEAQATDEMLALLHPVDVSPGDSVLVPSGTPHSIDAGTFVLEVQEPTDWSILLEWDGFDVDGRGEGHLGLGFDLAMRAIRPGALDGVQLGALIRRASAPDAGVPAGVLPTGSEPYFRVWRLVSAGSCPVPGGFGILLVTEGAGNLRASGITLDIERGVAVVIPDAARCWLDGEVGAYFAQPPAPDAPEAEEWDA